MHGEFELLVNLSVLLVAALILGLLTQRLGLSPIVGYLLAGIALGPQTPGFVADPKLAAQFAEIGVVLLMFGVGLHFQVRDLLAVRRIAVPGAIGQIAAATALGSIASVYFGWGFGAGLVIGVAISVASTVMLVRVLMENEVLDSPQGHTAVGWLIVEDIFTVGVLVLLPGLAGSLAGEGGDAGDIVASLAIALLKLAGLVLVIFVVGRRGIPWLLRRIARFRSRELFTLAVLALALAVATGSAVGFGVSMALGAFLAGMVVGQSEMSHQAASDALPMRDAFAVLFFVAMGMLFDPAVIAERPMLLVSLLVVILVAKPLVALLIIWFLGYSVCTGLTVAVGLAQIGEFSFILAGLAVDHDLLPSRGLGVLVACALVSIAINPVLFRSIAPIERWLRRRERLWRLLSRRSERRYGGTMAPAGGREEQAPEDSAIVVGYGPVGRIACRILEDFGIHPVVIDMNLETVRSLSAAGRSAVYGDATRREILEAARIPRARYLLVTIPDPDTRTSIILAARDLNRSLRIITRARYLLELGWLNEIGADEVCTEEAETAVGLAVLLLREVGASDERVREEVAKMRDELSNIQ